MRRSGIRRRPPRALATLLAPAVLLLVAGGLTAPATGGSTATAQLPHLASPSNTNAAHPGQVASAPSPSTAAGGTSYWIDLTSKYTGSEAPPSVRAFGAFTYDASANEFILYGGENGGLPLLSDTWAFTIASGWKKLSPSSNPGGLAEPAMVYDSTDSEIVLFGGCAGLSPCPSSSTYIFSQGTWSQYTTGTSPAGTLAAGIADDPAAGDVVMFGGCGSFSVINEDCNSGGFLDTTYTFTAAAGWKSVSSPTYPSGREAPFMSYDPGIGAPLLYGGYDGSSEFGDTWEFKGDQWIQLHPATNPTPATNGVLFWDAALNAEIMYGGDTSAATVGTTWEFSGGNWTQLFPPLFPPPRDGVMAATPTTGTPVLWGGELNGSSLQQDTWTFDPLSATTTVTPTTTDVGQPVSFSSTISGGDPPLTISWAFGDGTTAAVANTTHTYSSACSCSATLTVTDSLGQTAGGATLVNISALPAITAAVNDSSALVGVPVQFWGNATGGAAPTNITWNFGDGLTGSGPHPWHPYTVPGTKTATVTVIDGIGKSATASVTINVKAPPGALVVSVAASPLKGTNPLTVWFNSTVTGGVGGDTYAWSFGDGTTSTSANTSHVYVNPGVYAANLTVTDSSGVPGSGSATITVSPHPLGVTAAGTPLTGSTPLSVAFSAAAAGGIGPYSYNWSFGDGPEHSLAASPVHVFNNTGTATATYTVTLLVKDHETPVAENTTTFLVTVLPVPPLVASLAFWSNPPVNVTANYFVNASGGVPGYSFTWDFGDGTWANTTVNTTTHEYTSAVSYHLTVLVVDMRGKNVTVSATVNVGASAAIPVAPTFSISLFGDPQWYLYVILPILAVAMAAGAVYFATHAHRRGWGQQGFAPPPTAHYSEPSYYPGHGWR